MIIMVWVVGGLKLVFKRGKISWVFKPPPSPSPATSLVRQNMEMDRAVLHRSFIIEEQSISMPLCCKLEIS